MCLRVSFKQNKSLSNRLFEILCVLYRGGDLCDTNQGTQWQGRIWEVCPNTPQYSQHPSIQLDQPSIRLHYTSIQLTSLQYSQHPVNTDPLRLQYSSNQCSRHRPWTPKDCSSCNPLKHLQALKSFQDACLL